MMERQDDAVKKRLPGKNASFKEEEYSTDESTALYDKDKKNRRGGKRSEVDKDRINASVIWFVLVIGLMFCMMDALYIVRVLDQGPSIEDETNSLAADLVLRELQRQSKLGALVHAGRALNRQDFSDAVHAEKDLQVYSAKKLSAVEQQHPYHNNAPQVNRVPPAGGGNPFSRGGVVQRVQQAGNGLFNGMTRAQRIAQMKKEKEEAEAKRQAAVKMAALEALKAENGGELPADLKDLEDDEAFKARPITNYLERAKEDDKAFILDIFMEAGLKEMDDSTYKVLPTGKDVKDLYGTEPIIVGLEQCEVFQAKGNLWDHFVSTAGMFNSGTNLMAELLIHNCHMAERMKKLGVKNKGIRWQVPWGKHTPPGDEQYRLEHKSVKDTDVDANMIIPAVTVRDPYYWMQSMCKHHYTASWRPSDRCPNLKPLPQDIASAPSLKNKDYFPLSVRYADFSRQYKGLTGLWNDWYNEYKGVEFQRLFVRYEDLLFFPKEVTETVCKCAGGTMNPGRFQYQVDSAKKGKGAHGNVRTGYVDAIIKYGSERHRYNGYLPEDLKYAREHLDETMMKEFGYKYHPMSLETGEGIGGKGFNAGNEHEDDAEEEEEEGDSNREHPEEKEEPDIPGEEGENEEQGENEPEKSEDIGDTNDEQEEGGDEEEQ